MIPHFDMTCTNSSFVMSGGKPTKYVKTEG